MKRLVLPITVLMTLLWALIQPPEILDFSAAFLPLRKAYTDLLGALALAWMAVCMVLALRPVWLERFLGGLDRLYFVHKWTGIGAVILVVAHWLLILSPRTLVEWGWLQLPARGPRPPHGGGFSIIGLAKEMGEWSAWIMIVIGIVSILRFIPYHHFRKLHKLFPVAFLVGAFHSIVMVTKLSALGSTAFGIVLVVMSIAGSAISLYSLAGRIGLSRRYRGTIASVTTHAGGVIDLSVTPAKDWPGHTAGQFVLLTLEDKEGAHPFTIASDGEAGGALRFAIKPLGDYTRSLSGRINAGDTVTLEGPYGCFTFGDSSEPQVWIAGGIGVTPFVARLERLAADHGAKSEIHFFYCVRSASDLAYPANLEELCRRAGVTLHLHVDEHAGIINNETIGSRAKNAKSVWFCGPERWGRALRATLQQRFGLPSARFHSEAFDFR